VLCSCLDKAFELLAQEFRSETMSLQTCSNVGDCTQVASVEADFKENAAQTHRVVGMHVARMVLELETAGMDE
jgi:hypothetical protein